VTVERFVKSPGEAPSTTLPDGSTMTVYGDHTPTWVRLPPDLGGARVAVTHAREVTCPMMGCGSHRGFVTSAPAPRDGMIALVECPESSRIFWVRVQ